MMLLGVKQDAREAPQRWAKGVPYPVLFGCSHKASCITCFSTSLLWHATVSQQAVPASQRQV